MKSKFMHVKRVIMPLMQAIILISSLAGCGAVNQTQFQELINMADDVSVEMYVGQLAETGGESTVWLSQTGINSIASTESKGLASTFVSGYQALKPAQTLMNVMTGNQSEAKYFMEPNASLQQTADKSSEFQVAYTAANDMYAQISPDQLDVNETVSKLVKAALGSQVYYNTWQASFNGDDAHVADNFYNGQMNKLDMVIQVFNAVYGYEAIPGDYSLYGEETAGMIEAFKQNLSDVSAAIRDNEGQTTKQQALADSIDNLLESSDCENTVRKLMYMQRYMDSDPFGNTTIFQTEESSENVVDSIYFQNATKMDAVQIIYNVVRDLQPDFDETLKDKNYAETDAASLSGDFKDLNGGTLQVKQLDDLYTAIVTTDDGVVETQRDKVSVVREYQSYKASDTKAKDLTLTADQWAVYQDAKANTNIMVNLTTNSTADYRLLGNLQVTDLYSMLLGASSDMKGYSNELATQSQIEVGGEQNVELDGDIETQDYEFDAAVAQYEMENALTDEDIIADESLKLGLFEWLDDNGVGYINAQEDKEAGCENPFIDEYIEWTYNKANSPSDEGEQPSAENPDLKPGQTVDKNGIIINPDGSMELPASAAEGGHAYTDEDRAQMEAHNEEVKEWVTSQEYQDKLNEYAERFGY